MESQLIKDQNIFENLKELQIDSAILKGLHSLEILNPTKAQSALITSYIEGSKKITLNSGFQSGKTVSSLILLAHQIIEAIPNFKPAQDDQNGLFGVLFCSSKEQSQKNTIIAQKLLKFCKKRSNLSILNINQPINQISLLPGMHYILIGTLSNFLKFSSALQFKQQYYSGFIFDELDYMISFGYKQDLENFQFHFQTNINDTNCLIIITQNFDSDTIKESRGKILTPEQEKLITIEQDLLEEGGQDGEAGEGGEEMTEEQKKEAKTKLKEKKNEKALQNYNLQQYKQVSQFYSFGDDITKYIIVYILFKLQFIYGKTLIIVKNVDEIYKMQLFLERIGVKQYQVYNPQDPKNLRYYILSIFNTGVVKILISTNQVVEDLQSKIFFGKKRKIIQFKNLNNVIILDLLQVNYDTLFSLFRGFEGTIISCLQQNREDEIEALTSIIETQRAKFNQHLNIKEFPLKQEEINAFNYRISDVVTHISMKQIKNSRSLDFKKKLLRSQELKEYFAKNQNEKETLMQEVIKLSKQVTKYAVRCDLDVPDYLVPQVIKEHKKKMENKQQSSIKQVLVFKGRKNKPQKIQNKRDAEDGEADQNTEEMISSGDVIKKKRKFEGDKYVTVDESKENVEELDPSRLKIISGRKLWKLKHGYKLKKRNKFLEKKGIFNV